MAAQSWTCLACRATLGVRLPGKPGHGDTLELRSAAEMLIRRTGSTTVVCVCGASKEWRGGRVVAPADPCGSICPN